MKEGPVCCLYVSCSRKRLRDAALTKFGMLGCQAERRASLGSQFEDNSLARFNILILFKYIRMAKPN